jgi:transposase InsO family protein
VAGIADYWSKVEFGWHWSPTANQHDAIAAVEVALAEAQRLLDGPTLLEHLTDPDTGEVVPITLVTDNGGPFRSFRSRRSSPPDLNCGTAAPESEPRAGTAHASAASAP